MIKYAVCLLLLMPSLVYGSVAPKCEDRASKFLKAGQVLIATAGLDSDVRTAFAKSNRNNQDSGCVELDINGDGTMDIAVIIRETSIARLIIYDGLLEKTDPMYSMAITGYETSTFLKKFCGEIPTQSEALPVRSDHKKSNVGDILEVTYFEKARLVLFMDKLSGIIESIQTSD